MPVRIHRPDENVWSVPLYVAVAADDPEDARQAATDALLDTLESIPGYVGLPDGPSKIRRVIDVSQTTWPILPAGSRWQVVPDDYKEPFDEDDWDVGPLGPRRVPRVSPPTDAGAGGRLPGSFVERRRVWFRRFARGPTRVPHPLACRLASGLAGGPSDGRSVGPHRRVALSGNWPGAARTAPARHQGGFP